MANNQLTTHDYQLIEHAKEYLTSVFTPQKVYVAAAIQAADGTTYQGFNIKAQSGKASICAESIALSQFLKAKSTQAQTLVVVAYAPEQPSKPVIISPCGNCRDLLVEYLPHIAVIIQNAPSELLKVPIEKLLPYPYTL